MFRFKSSILIHREILHVRNYATPAPHPVKLMKLEAFSDNSDGKVVKIGKTKSETKSLNKHFQKTERIKEKRKQFEETHEKNNSKDKSTKEKKPEKKFKKK